MKLSDYECVGFSTHALGDEAYWWHQNDVFAQEMSPANKGSRTFNGYEEEVTTES
jgi:hypothetical protein